MWRFGFNAHLQEQLQELTDYKTTLEVACRDLKERADTFKYGYDMEKETTARLTAENKTLRAKDPSFSRLFVRAKANEHYWVARQKHLEDECDYAKSRLVLAEKVAEAVIKNKHFCQEDVCGRELCEAVKAYLADVEGSMSDD